MKDTIIIAIDTALYGLTIAVGVLFLMFIAENAKADCYLDAGVMVNDTEGSWKEVDGEYVQDIINPIGMIEAGCDIDRVTVFIYHSTSVQMQDSGINSVGVKYRLFGK